MKADQIDTSWKRTLLTYWLGKGRIFLGEYEIESRIKATETGLLIEG